MTNLLGLQIANGFSSEASVFARLLGNRAGMFEPTVVMHQADSDEGPVGAFREQADCRVVPFDTGWRPNSSGRRLTPGRMMVASRFLHRIGRIPDLAKTFQPDVVYSCQQHYDFRASAAVARRLQLPQIVHLHYTIGPWLTGAVVEGLREVNHVIAVSDFIRQNAIDHGVAPDRVTTVRNAIGVASPIGSDRIEELRRELGVGHGFVVGMTGRLDQGKGHRDAITAFSELANEVPDAWMVIAGRGTLDDRLRQLASRCAGGDRIRFLGHRSDVSDLLNVFDVLCHPSIDDPCPLAVLEASAAARPVVAYAQGGALELIEHEVTGKLVPVNSTQGLATALKELHADRVRARELGEAAAARVATDFRPDVASTLFSRVVDRTVSLGQ